MPAARWWPWPLMVHCSVDSEFLDLQNPSVYASSVNPYIVVLILAPRPACHLAPDCRHPSSLPPVLRFPALPGTASLSFAPMCSRTFVFQVQTFSGVDRDHGDSLLSASFSILGSKLWHRLDATVMQVRTTTIKADATVEVQKHFGEPNIGRPGEPFWILGTTETSLSELVQTRCSVSLYSSFVYALRKGIL